MMMEIKKNHGGKQDNPAQPEHDQGNLVFSLRSQASSCVILSKERMS
ncbi:MAG: hypothetical protein M1438_04360 [Deltaproteobacteria bacterium]|nr:hypothetical protein [Deltaproteobacteria bacterium]